VASENHPRAFQFHQVQPFFGCPVNMHIFGRDT